MALTIPEAEAAARALRRWPAGKRAYALAWSPQGAGYHQVSSLARALRGDGDQKLLLDHLGPCATIALMRLRGVITTLGLGEAIRQATHDLAIALDLAPRVWVEALADPVSLAARLERWAVETRAHLQGTRLDPAGVSPPSLLQVREPGRKGIVPLSTTARQVLRILKADPDARLYYDRREKSWFVSARKNTRFKVREQTAGWMIREELVDLEPLALGQPRRGTDLQYIASALGLRCFTAEEGSGVEPG